MRTVVLVLLGLALLAPPASAQGSWADKLFKDGTTHDFGSVPRGTQLYKRFKLTNIYAVPLEISAKRGCTCLTITPERQVLQPRQDAFIDVDMDAHKFLGQKEVKSLVTVTNGTEYASSTTLVVTANSRTDVVLNPGQVSCGVVSRGQRSAAQTIDVEYAGVLDWRVTEIAKHSAPLDASFKELYRRPGQVGYRVTVAVKPDAPAGSLKHELFLKTNDPAGPLVPILVEANVQASLSVAPNPVSLGTLKVGEALTKLVIVRASRPFKVAAVEGQGDGLTAELPSASQTAQIVKIKWQPVKSGAVKRQLKIKTDLVDETSIPLTVEGLADP
jgi:hypothetical protein